MLKFLQRRLFVQILIYFTVSLGIFELMFLFGNVFQFFRKGISFADSLYIIPYIIPYSFPYALPMAFMAAVTLVVGKMSIDNEIMVLKSSGIHLSFLAAPVLIMGLFLGATSYYSQAEFIPYSYKKVKVFVRTSVTANFLTNKGRDQSFRIQGIQMYCDAFSEGHFEGVSLQIRRKAMWINLIAESGVAQVVGKNQQILLTLSNVVLTDVRRPWQSFYNEKMSILLDVTIRVSERDEFKTTKKLWKIYGSYDERMEKPNLTEDQLLTLQHDKNYTLGAIFQRYCLAVGCISLTLISLGISFGFQHNHRMVPLLASLVLAGAFYFAPFFLAKVLIKRFAFPADLAFAMPMTISMAAGLLILWWSFRR